MRINISLLCLLFSMACTALPREPHWIGSWGASPVPPRETAIGPFPATPAFSNQTIRQTIRLSAGGGRLRLRLTNEYGSGPLEIGAATVARIDPDGETRLGTVHAVTFGGHRSATIPAGAPLLSDPVDLSVDDLETLSIALYLPQDTGLCTCHPWALQPAYVSQGGDFTATDFVAEQTIDSRAFLSGVEVLPREPGRAIVMLGDSITDSFGSTSGSNRRWPDRLAERLAARDDAPSYGVVNAGITGNRILSDGAGESALARFDRDVLAVSGVTHVVVFEGVNDVGLRFWAPEGPWAKIMAGLPRGAVSAETMIAGYRQLISRAHAKGLRIYGATIAPYKGAYYFSSEGEAVRQQINAWIRQSGEFDAMLDFDAVVRDPSQPAAIVDGLHRGDFLHLNDEGYRRIADTIDLDLFN